MPDLLTYPPKILLAFGESIGGNNEITDWMIQNGYPELAALSHAIQGSDEAFLWLMKNKFPELAALDSAIDEDPKAYEWLKNSNYLFHIIFAECCRGKQEAIAWMLQKDLNALVRIAQKIKHLRDSQTFDYHKLHF